MSLALPGSGCEASSPGTGTGRALVVATLGRLRELGYASAYLTTGSDNRPAIGLYPSLGFVPAPSGRRPL